MLIVYASLTGNVERFVKRTLLRSVKISNDLKVDEHFILVTYTTGFGEVPREVTTFLQVNHRNLRAVASSGNMNWGTNFGKSADLISKEYKVPVLMKFELAGTKKDTQLFIERVGHFGAHQTE